MGEATATGFPEALGPYGIAGPIIPGGTSFVTRARHRSTGEVVALKIVRGNEEPLRREMLRRELATLKRLTRLRVSGLARLVEAGQEADGTLWGALELVSGETLGAWRRRLWQGESEVDLAGRLRKVLEVFRELADVLDELHASGLVHGDLSPENVLVSAAGRPTLVDFGNAYRAGSGATAREHAQVSASGRGTPGYMAPEQIVGAAVDARCDLYAFGALLYECATDAPPFRAADAASLLRQHLEVNPAPPSSEVAGIPSALDELVLELLAKDPLRRIGHASEVAARLAVLLGLETKRVSVRPIRLYPSRLVGREAAVDRLRDALGQAARGAGGLWLVAAESGAGKTRLINELVRLATAQGFGCRPSACGDAQDVGEGATVNGRPLAALVPLLRELAAQLPRAPRQVVDALAAGLPWLAPYESALLALPEARATLPAVSAELARTRVIAAATEALRASAHDGPSLIVIDDLQWADDMTLAVLSRVAEVGLAGAPVLVVGTFRSEEGTAALRALETKLDERVVTLGRLGASEIELMVADMLSARVLPSGLAGLVLRQSEGNPLFVAEVVRGLVDQGALKRDGRGEWTFADIALLRDAPAAGLPTSLQALLQRRLSGLSELARNVLDLAAVQGAEIDVAGLEWLSSAEALGAQVDVASDIGLALDELAARQVLVPRADGQYGFAHEKLREAHEAAMAPARRRALHRRIAQSCERASPPAHDAAALLKHRARLGWHWAAAGEPARAVRPLAEAARTAEQMHANGQAIELFRLALREANASGGSADEETSPLRLGEALADLLVRAARHAEGRDRYDLTVAATSAGETVRRARLLRKKSQSFWTLHEYEAARAALDEAEGQLGEPSGDEDHREWIEIQRCRFFLLYFSRQVGEPTRALVERMRPVVEAFGDRAQRSSFLQCAAMEVMARTRYQDDGEAVSFARQSLEAVCDEPALALQANEARFTLGLALALGRADDCAEAIEVLQASAREADRTGDPTLRSRALVYLALAQRRRGDVPGARATGQMALEVAGAAHLHPYMASATACLAWADWREGDEASARRRATLAEELWAKSPHAFPFRWQATLVLLALHHQAEDLAEAQTIARLLVAPQQQRFPPPLQRALEVLAGEGPAAPSEAAASASLDEVMSRALALRYL